MTAQIRKTGVEDPNLIAEREVKTVNDLDAFLMEHGLIRDFRDLREDVKWDGVSYFVKEDQ